MKLILKLCDPMKITNIVAVAKVKDNFDLDILNSRLENTELTKSKNWLKMRLKPNNNYVAFYASGKFLITGVNTFEDVENIVMVVLKKLKDSKIYTELEEIKVSNIVLTDKIEMKFSLDTIINFLDSSNSSYEPEQFPGLFYKDKDGINFTLFNSGKIIMTGVKNLDIAENNLKRFKEMIKNIN